VRALYKKHEFDILKKVVELGWGGGVPLLLPLLLPPPIAPNTKKGLW
jgi:hypothetical protein